MPVRPEGIAMLSDVSYAVISDTLPLVAGHFPEIAQRFYDRISEVRPDLLARLFPRGNRTEGWQQQALAGSLSAFAGALVAKRGQSPEPLLSRVAQYHASLGLGPAQYLVLRDQLMWAIVDVLGDTVTLTMTAAWDELYWLMTDMLNNIAPDPAPPPS